MAATSAVTEADTSSITCPAAALLVTGKILSVVFSNMHQFLTLLKFHRRCPVTLGENFVWGVGAWADLLFGACPSSVPHRTAAVLSRTMLMDDYSRDRLFPVRPYAAARYYPYCVTHQSPADVVSKILY